MSQSDDPEIKYDHQKHRIETELENHDPIIEVLKALDANEKDNVFIDNGERETKTYNTLSSYATRLRLFQKRVGCPLMELSMEEINDAMDRISDEYANSTVAQYQSALKLFYKYHDDHNINPDDIMVNAGRTSTFDERDLFTVQEVERMKRVKSEFGHPREVALLDILAHTGQRIRAIQTLRVKDVDPSEGVMWLNDSEGGLKGSKGKRPLLGASESIQEWLDVHPTGNPEDALFTAIDERGDPGSQLRQNTMRYHLKKAAKSVGIDPDRMSAHAFRHYWTTRAYRDFGLDDQYIKKIRGDIPGSDIFETTYTHLTDGDAINEANKVMGNSD